MARFPTRYCPACGCDAKTKQVDGKEVYFRHRKYQADRDYCINSNEPIDRPYVIGLGTGIASRYLHRIERPEGTT